MRRAVELPDVHDIVLVFEYRGLVVVDVEIVWCAKNGHYTGEASGPRLSVHSVPSILRFVCPNNREKIVLFQECAGGRVGEEVRASANVVVNKEFRSLFLTKFFKWISPQYVTH